MPVRALITSGGGAKGAFSVGALKRLAELGVDRYDIISGTSTGAMIAALATARAFDTLVKIYLSVGNHDILNQQNVIDNFIARKPFPFSTDPLKEMVVKHINTDVFNKIMASDTILCLTAISLQTGRPTVFCSKPVPPSEHYDLFLIDNEQLLRDALMASSSQAGFLPPVDIQTGVDTAGRPVIQQFVDGGNREVIPSRVITQLNPDEVFVLSNNPPDLFVEKKDYSRDSVISLILRAISIFIQEVRENDLSVLNDFARDRGIPVHRVEPETDLDPANPTGLNFSIDSMMIWMAKGRRKVEEIIAPVM